MGRGQADGIAVDGGNDRLVELELTGHSATADHGVVDLAFFEDVAARALRQSPSRRRPDAEETRPRRSAPRH